MGYVLGRECTFRVSLVGLVEKLFDFFVGEILQMFFWQRFLFRDFWVGMFPQTVFRFLLELAWKRFLFKVCLVAHFSTDIFGYNFIFAYFLAAISLSICFSVFLK